MKFGRWKSISLRQRFTVGIAARLLPLIGLTFGALIALENTIQSFKTNESKALSLVFPLKDLEKLVFDASYPLTDYLDTGDRQQRDRFLTVSRNIDYQFAKLLKDNQNNTETENLLLESQKSWRQFYQTAMEVFNYPNSISKSKALQAEKQLDERSRKVIESISRIYNYLYHTQKQENIDQSQELETRVRLIAQILLGLELTLAIISGLVLWRSIFVPLDKLEEGVKQLSDGNLSYQINLNSSDELGKLAATLNLMAQKLQQTQTELRDLAIKDGLTGLFNRREFNHQLETEVERAQRYNQDCSLVMMDIDYFKKLNDTYGHQGGDEALRAVAQILQREVRPVDRVARYGGEEFAIILPQTSSDGAIVVAERLRSAIANHSISVSTTQTINVTISAGCATFPDHANSGDSLISAADEALYSAKKSGRNRVVICNQS